MEDETYYEYVSTKQLGSKDILWMNAINECKKPPKTSNMTQQKPRETRMPFRTWVSVSAGAWGDGADVSGVGALLQA